MNMDPDSYYNLAERIEDAFSEIDSETCADLRDADGEYAEMWRENIKLQHDFPIITEATEGDGAISLSAEEHGTVVRYLSLKNDMENMERKQIYFRGHTDCIAYLKKIGAI